MDKVHFYDKVLGGTSHRIQGQYWRLEPRQTQQQVYYTFFLYNYRSWTICIGSYNDNDNGNDNDNDIGHKEEKGKLKNHFLFIELTISKRSVS